VVERARRRQFSAQYKQRIVREVDQALASGEEGAVGALLRREGLYSSHLTSWRKQRERGELAGLAPRKRGRKAKPTGPLAAENERLQRQVARLEADLEKARIVIAVQKKVAELLGNPIPSDPEEES
jgi:transposase-like protein